MSRTAMICAALFAVATAGAVEAKTLRWAFQGDAQGLDPYVLNETFTLGFLGNVYEGLIRRGPDLEVQPALAERWEVLEPTRWRFHLRKNVKFHNGNAFDADDVVFSANRVRAAGSDLKTRIAADVKVVKVDTHTVDFITPAPNPILHSEWGTWYIMDKEWTEEHDAVQPASVTAGTENYANFHTNGTGPFVVVERETDVRTVLKPNPDWWDQPRHNLTEVVMTPISSDATRVAALLSGQIDMAYPVPVQDIRRVQANDGTSMLVGPELRTIFLGFDQGRDELLESDVRGNNPFKDKRVRAALYHAVDVEAIGSKVMRNLATPSALMISPTLFARSGEFARHTFDPALARQLLADAGYPDGFEIGMDCPNNRYVNDERICIAVSAMLAKIGIKVKLLAQPKALFFKKVLGPAYQTSLYLLGWTPGSFDSWNVLYNLIHCQEADGAGKFNLGNYCNPAVDALTEKILVETDPVTRDAMIAEAYRLVHDDFGYIPLHQQGLAWGKSDLVDLVQSPDNQFMLYYVNIR